MAAQGTAQWKMRRLGKATASRIFDIVDLTVKGKYKASRDHYMNQLANEIITQQPTEGFTSVHMKDGTRQEPIARVYYEFSTGQPIEEVEFVDHPTIANSGSSPDGLIAPDGFIEIKAPKLETHLKYVETQVIPPQYLCQIGWNFACMPERKWCDFISFCDQLPTDEQMYVSRVMRDDLFIRRLEKEVEKFNIELEARVNELRG